MLTLLLASGNKNKIREFERLLAPLGDIRLLSLSDIGFKGDIEENGTTFEENALIKARAGAALGYVTIADDSGLEVDALGGAPGVYSARYSGMHGDDKANNRKLLSEMKGQENRKGRYVCVIACAAPNGDSFTVRGECEGLIAEEEKGSGGFGYDPLFYLPMYGRTMAEISAEEKNSMSHRAEAAAAFCRVFAERRGSHADK